METNQDKNQFNDDAELARIIRAQRGIVEPEPTPEPAPAPTPEPTPEPTPAPASEFNDDIFNQYLSQKTGGKYSKLEDIQIAEISDEAKPIYDILKEGKTDELYEYLRKSREDYSKWSTEDLLRQKLQNEYPNMSKQDIEEIITHDYMLGHELSDEDRENLTPAQIKEFEINKKRAESKAIRDAESMRNALEASKKEIVLPKIDKLEPVAPAPDPNEPTPEQIAQAQREWEAEVEAELPKVKDLSFEFKIGEDGDVLSTNFKLEGDQEKAVATAIKTIYEPGDEKLTMAQLAEKTAFKLFGRQILNTAIKDAVAKAKEKFVERELKQIDLNPGANRGNSGGEKNIYQHLLDQ